MEPSLFAIALSALVPSLFPTRRGMARAASVYALLIAGFLGLLWLFAPFDEKLAAFLGVVFLSVLILVVLIASCAVKLVIGSILFNRNPEATVLLRCALLASGVAIALMVEFVVLQNPANLDFAARVGTAALWFGLAIWLIPNNARKADA